MDSYYETSLNCAETTACEISTPFIGQDEPQSDDTFTAKASYCHGYDVFGQLIHKASFTDYLLLMFTGEKPCPQNSKLFEIVSVSLANRGPRDAAVRAAMNAGVGGAPAASSLIAALAIKAGNTAGCREIFFLTQCFHRYHTDRKRWIEQLKQPNQEVMGS